VLLWSISIDSSHLDNVTSACSFNFVRRVQRVCNSICLKFFSLRRINILHIKVSIRYISDSVLFKLLRSRTLDISHRVLLPFNSPVFAISIWNYTRYISCIQFIMSKSIFHHLRLGLQYHGETIISEHFSSPRHLPLSWSIINVKLIYSWRIDLLRIFLISRFLLSVSNITRYVIRCSTSIVFP